MADAAAVDLGSGASAPVAHVDTASHGLPSLSKEPSSLPALLPGSSPSTSLLTSRGQSFLLRPLDAGDAADIAELARYSYEGKDFIVADFKKWMSPRSSLAPLPIGVVYLGPSSPPSASPSGEADPRAAYVGHVIAIEVALFEDEGITAWLYALRVHPTFRALSLSSVLHAFLISEAERRPGVLRLRESTERSNSVSNHLARKHGFHVQYESRWYWLYRADYHARVTALRLLMERCAVDPALAALRTDGGLLAPGAVADVLEVQARHSSRADFQQLVLNWICYEFTAANLERLTTEPGLAHEVTVSYATAESDEPVAFSMTRFAEDFSGMTQHVSVYAVDVRHLLLHLWFALARQASNADSDERYQRPMIFLPAFFEPDLVDETETAEGKGSAWSPDMFFLLLERPVRPQHSA